MFSGGWEMVSGDREMVSGDQELVLDDQEVVLDDQELVSVDQEVVLGTRRRFWVAKRGLSCLGCSPTWLRVCAHVALLQGPAIGTWGHRDGAAQGPWGRTSHVP